ncbi:hypothetical protein [Paenibacillus gorillae]|uniref:hypothetical protein n=1 Tax=Paenibacillus gorillae TaxID=1243662 RepID=UPI0005A6207C|nr:hypothetical protein [Paenibacillus gorillae]
MGHNVRLFVSICHTRRCRPHRQRPADRLAKPKVLLDDSALSDSGLLIGSIQLPQELEEPESGRE